MLKHSPVTTVSSLAIKLESVLSAHLSSAVTVDRKVCGSNALTRGFLKLTLSGHTRHDCENPPKMAERDIAILTSEAAWEKLMTAISERDGQMAREAIEEYAKANNHTITFRQLQESLIREERGLWLIASETPLMPAFTNIDLQGNPEKAYAVSCRFSERPQRPRERQWWPKDREELLARLDDAGFKGGSGKIICENCREAGHSTRACTQEKPSVAVTVTCHNCGEEGHRVRNCEELPIELSSLQYRRLISDLGPQPIVDKFACKNCG